jgi:hypothetical protein
MKPLFALLAAGAATWIAADAFAQTSDDSSANANPAVNRRESRDYTSLVDHNAAFRTQRMHKECDPIQSPDLRRECIQSFSADATSSSGSSGAR